MNDERIAKVVLYGSLALALELVGVNSGAYTYGEFPLKLDGVPLSIPLMWVLVGFLSCFFKEKLGWKGVLLTALIDLLILEPLTYFFNVWWWTNPRTALVNPFGTVANFLVWLVMAGLGAILF